jgi:hypothetical protein
MPVNKKTFHGPEIVPDGDGLVDTAKSTKKDTKGKKPLCVKKDGDHKFRSPCNY